jgi:hypothetical protein
MHNCLYFNHLQCEASVEVGGTLWADEMSAVGLAGPGDAVCGIFELKKTELRLSGGNGDH